MNCYYHPHKSAVATCSDCGKGLCQECADKWNPILCDDCAGNQLSIRQSTLKRTVIIGVVLFIAGFLAYYWIEGNVLKALLGGYLIAGVPNGWAALSKIQPRIFLFLPIIGWVIYFIVKFVLACFVGLGVFPINIIRCVTELKSNKSLER